MSQTQALLDQVKNLQTAKDAAGLKALEDHADKAVRKAARKALHVLKAKGVEIPEQARSWADASLQSLRRTAGPIAMIDMAASPAVTRLTLSIPDDEDGAALFVALLDPTDRLLDFRAYRQTDGQQTRTARDWQRDANGRVLSAAWVQARMLWSREQTHQRHVALPPAFDEHLVTLAKGIGPIASERPQPVFLDEALAAVEPAASDLGQILIVGGVHTWPLLFPGDQLFERLAERMKDVDANEITNEDRLAHIMEASSGDEALRTALRGPLANGLDDVAVVLWLDGSLAEARRVRKLAVDMRGSDTPERVDGVVNLVQLQLTSAAMKQMRERGQAGDDHDHDHDHDGHVHDENCDHDHDHDHG
jgi:ABC-type nickel/cobalt efflux system permease component RcnA